MKQLKEKKKILLIAGAPRSGSTLLSKLLNEIDNAFNVNELVYMHLKGIEHDFPCNTGEKFSESAVWQAIMQAYKQRNTVDHLRYQPNIIPNTRKLVAAQLLPFYQANHKASETYKTAINDLFHAIFEATQADLIIDSSKIAPFVNIVKQLEDFDIYVLHLVRDPRAVAYSWQKTIRRADVESGTELFMETCTPRRSSIRWQLVNTFSSSLKNCAHLKYQYLKYEHFVQEPAAHLAKILAFLGYDKREILIQNNKVMLKRTDYGIWGNPNVRQQKSTLHIRYDDTYKQKMKPRVKQEATLYALPLLTQYGYKIRL